MRENLLVAQKCQQQKDLKNEVGALGLQSFGHRALQQWKGKQDTAAGWSKEPAGEMTISEGNPVGHPYITSSAWSMLG